MMPSVLSTDPIPSVPKCNWCNKRSLMTVKNVPKMTKKNDRSVRVFSYVHF